MCFVLVGILAHSKCFASASSCSSSNNIYIYIILIITKKFREHSEESSYVPVVRKPRKCFIKKLTFEIGLKGWVDSNKWKRERIGKEFWVKGTAFVKAVNIAHKWDAGTLVISLGYRCWTSLGSHWKVVERIEEGNGNNNKNKSS